MSNDSAPPRALFLGSEYAGNRTRFRSIEKYTRDDPRIRPTYRGVTGWREDGSLERLPLVPDYLKGRARVLMEGSILAKIPRPDIIWTSAATAAGPFLWSQLGPLRRPLVVDIDETLELREGFAPIYYRRPARKGLSRRLLELQERWLWSSATLFIAPFRWVGESLQRGGVPEDRIRLLWPGVDIEAWRPRPELRSSRSDALRLVFVGQDFWRKGGDLLIEVMNGPLGEQCELDIVTDAPIGPLPPSVRVHQFVKEHNSPFIRELYSQADIFVLPTRAECFAFANLEALASGLPVMSTNVGAIPEFVVPGKTGWIVEPSVESINDGLRHALARREEVPEMGRNARQMAVDRFDASVNDQKVVDVLLEARDLFEKERGR